VADGGTAAEEPGDTRREAIRTADAADLVRLALAETKR
jgi:hypothetical protein